MFVLFRVVFAKKRVGGKVTEGEIKDVKYCFKLNRTTSLVPSKKSSTNFEDFSWH
jgi:hypothetical protein